MLYRGLFDSYCSNQPRLMTSVEAALERLQSEDKQQQQPAAPWRRHLLLSGAKLNRYMYF